jgi:predicted Zn-dependent protease
MSSSTEDPRVLPQLNRWLDHVRADGARGAELVHKCCTTHALQIADGRRTGGPPTTTVELSGFVYLEGGRTGRVSLSNPAANAVPKALTKALRGAKRAAKNPTAGPVQRIGISERGMGIADRRYEMLDDESRPAVLQLNEDAVGNHAGIELLSIDYKDVRTVRTCSSSTENEATSVDTFYSVTVRVRDSHNGAELEATTAARNFSHVGSLPFGAELAKRLIALREPGNPPDGPVPLVLESRVAAWILARLAPAFAADKVADGSSFLAQREGRLAGPRLHLIDDPGLHGGLRTLPFDDRGVSPSPVAIIREGLMEGLYQSPETARIADIRPTGHVRGGALVPTNLILRPGNRSRTQMLSEVPVAISYDRLDGEFDLATGRLKCWGPAFVLEKGRPKGSLGRVDLDVDIVDLLLQVQEIAADQERHGHVDCATVLVRQAPLSW